MSSLPRSFKMVALGVLVNSGLLMLSAPVLAGAHYEYARVLDSRPIYQVVTVSVPRQECWEEQVPVRNARGAATSTGAIVSAIVGGAIGNAVGNNKSSRRVGAVAGAVLGHSIGRDIVAANSRAQGAHYQMVQRCETYDEYREEERLVGYEVRYRYNGQDYTIETDHDPGDRIRLQVQHTPVF